MATQPTHMSFSVKGEEEDFEYAGTPRGLFCQSRNLLSPRFQRMIVDLLRFNRELRRLLRQRGAPGASRSRSSSPAAASRASFVERLIVPQVSAVWSADPRQMRSFPARFIAEFFANHGMLGFRDRPRWSTMTGGSARYVEALTAPFRGCIRLQRPGALDHALRASTSRSRATASERRGYDQVVIATHSDQALAMLSDPSEREAELLGRDPLPAQRGRAAHRQHAAARAAARRARRGTSTCCASPSR